MTPLATSAGHNAILIVVKLPILTDDFWPKSVANQVILHYKKSPTHELPMWKSGWQTIGHSGSSNARSRGSVSYGIADESMSTTLGAIHGDVRPLLLLQSQNDLTEYFH